MGDSPAASKPAAGSAGVGDILRIHGQDGMTQIEGVTGGDDASITSFTLNPSWLGSSTDAGTLAANNDRTAGGYNEVYSVDHVAIIDNGFKYRVWFTDTAQGSAQPAYSPVAQADLTHPSAITAG